MVKPKIKFDVDGFENLRNDPAVRRDLKKRAQKIADSIGGDEKGYIVRENLGRETRAGVSVLATGYAANSNRKHQSLIKALPEGR